MNQTNQNNISPFVEQIVVEEQESNRIQDILNRFKQPIPQGFVELKLEEGNYLFSTNPKWTDKPLCERYGFYSSEGTWVQIDIPHKLMEDLELTPKEDIVYPLYLSSDSLEKSLTRGAIEIESENEIFFNRPVSEKNVEKELIKRLEELDDLREKLKKGLNKERKKITILDLSNHDLRSFDFTHYTELETIDISNNHFPCRCVKIDLSTNNKLKYLDISNSGFVLAWSWDIKFGDNKKTLEEFHFIHTMKSVNTSGSRLDLTEFTNLKKISYSWITWEIWLNKGLEGKVTRNWPTWDELGEDEQLCYIKNRPNTIYGDVMANMVIYK